jgi:exodeoxyribonuclease VIII
MNIMIDLETLGTGHDAAIVSIGAVSFNKQDIISGFYVTVDVCDAIRYGAVSGDTVKWWMQQSDEARKVFNDPNAMTLPQALSEFVQWLGLFWNAHEFKIWGNGAAFDNVILANAFDKCDLSTPWEFWNDRCYRTIRAQYPDVVVEREGTHHNALDDARYQVKVLQEIMRQKNIGGLL